VKGNYFMTSIVTKDKSQFTKLVDQASEIADDVNDGLDDSKLGLISKVI
jgi:hypothetical protein